MSPIRPATALDELVDRLAAQSADLAYIARLPSMTNCSGVTAKQDASGPHSLAFSVQPGPVYKAVARSTFSTAQEMKDLVSHLTRGSNREVRAAFLFATAAR